MKVFLEVFVNLFIIGYFITTFCDYKFNECDSGILRWKKVIVKSLIFSLIITISLAFMYMIIVGLCYLIITIM